MASGGGGRIRTFEGVSRQIYSLLPLAAWVPLRVNEPRIVISDPGSVNALGALFASPGGLGGGRDAGGAGRTGQGYDPQSRVAAPENRAVGRKARIAAPKNRAAGRKARGAARRNRSAAQQDQGALPKDRSEGRKAADDWLGRD
jgi:hypothetical protein